MKKILAIALIALASCSPSPDAGKPPCKKLCPPTMPKPGKCYKKASDIPPAFWCANGSNKVRSGSGSW